MATEPLTIPVLEARLQRGHEMLRQMELAGQTETEEYARCMALRDRLDEEYSRLSWEALDGAAAADSIRIFFAPADWNREQVRDYIPLLIEDSGWDERSVTDSYGVMATAQDAEAWVRKTTARYHATAVARHTDGWVIGQSVQERAREAEQVSLEVAS